MLIKNTIKGDVIILKIHLNYDELSDYQLIELFKKEYDRIRPKTCSEFYRQTTTAPSLFMIKKRLKMTWPQLLRFIGVDDKKIRFQRRSKEEYIQILNNLNEKLGHPPSSREFTEHGYTVPVIVEAFGSYNKALDAAGLKPRTAIPIKVVESKEELLEQYKMLCKKLGRTADWKDIENAEGMYSPHIYSIRFGGMRGLKITAGREPHHIDRRRYTKKMILRLLKNECLKTKRNLTSKEIETNPNLPCRNTILKHFQTTSFEDVWKEVNASLR